MSNPTVHELTAFYLKARGFEGLSNEDGECACELGDLAPCGEMKHDCVAGYKSVCDCGEHDWHIADKKPDALAPAPVEVPKHGGYLQDAYEKVMENKRRACSTCGE